MKLFIQWLQSICLIFGIFSSSLLHVLQMTQLKESDILLVIEMDIIYSGKLGFRMTCIWLNKVKTFFFFLVLVLLWTNNFATLLCLAGNMSPQWPSYLFPLDSKLWEMNQGGGVWLLKGLAFKLWIKTWWKCKDKVLCSGCGERSWLICHSFPPPRGMEGV